MKLLIKQIPVSAKINPKKKKILLGKGESLKTSDVSDDYIILKSTGRERRQLTHSGFILAKIPSVKIKNRILKPPKYRIICEDNYIEKEKDEQRHS